MCRLFLTGTEFQRRVWKMVANVGFGTTKSYIEIAREVGSADASRAVGMANGRNPIPLIIPCHRIIGHSGKLTGYAGGLERKKMAIGSRTGTFRERSIVLILGSSHITKVLFFLMHLSVQDLFLQLLLML